MLKKYFVIDSYVWLVTKMHHVFVDKSGYLLENSFFFSSTLEIALQYFL